MMPNSTLFAVESAGPAVGTNHGLASNFFAHEVKCSGDGCGKINPTFEGDVMHAQDILNRARGFIHPWC